MLVTTDLVRDVFANELIELAKCIDVMDKHPMMTPSNLKHDMKQHIVNMTNIVIKDFKHIPNDIRIWEIEQMAEALVRKRGDDEQANQSI